MFLAYVFKMLTTMEADTRDFDWGFYRLSLTASTRVPPSQKRRSYRKLSLCVIQTQQG